MPTNVAEEIVHRYFLRSFLSLWSYANPLGRNRGKELCDTLVVCDPDVVIVSVKASDLREDGDAKTNADRWRRRTINGSIRQIVGADRWVRDATRVIRSDGTPGLPFPSSRRIHRIAVAAGGRRRVKIESRDYGDGFVHVLDELSLAALIEGCDTVTDLVGYLAAREELSASGTEISFDGGEEDLLAVYLHRGHRFPPVLRGRGRLRGTAWREFSEKEEVGAKREADRVSYVWDAIIDHVAGQALAGNLEFGEALTEAEIILRTMAKEDRFARRMLAESYVGFLEPSNRVEARMMPSPSGVVYVFLAKPYGTDREQRLAELKQRCFVARGLHDGNATVVVGIATERRGTGQPPGSSLDFCHLRKGDWTEEDRRIVEMMQKELGYFAASRETSMHADEYPGVCDPVVLPKKL